MVERLVLFALISLAAAQTFCPQDVNPNPCPDGSQMGRDPLKNCSFYPCESDEGQPCGVTGFVCKSGLACRYDNGTRNPPYPNAEGRCWNLRKRSEGQSCGGFAGLQCQVWLGCRPNSTNPDAFGTCVACPLKKCAANVICPLGSTLQPSTDSIGCRDCDCCKTADGQCVDSLWPCGGDFGECVDGEVCYTRPEDNARYCQVCPLRRCVGDLLCPAGSTPQPNTDIFGCPGCDCCKTADGQCVDSLQRCAQNSECPDRHFCNTANPRHCDECFLPRCAVDVVCPIGTSLQPAFDSLTGCKTCDRCTTADNQWVDPLQPCGRGQPQCPNNYFCDVAANDAGSYCRRRNCQRDVQICPDGTQVSKNEQCNWYPCPSKCPPLPCRSGQQCNPRCKKSAVVQSYCQHVSFPVLTPSQIPKCPNS